MKRTVIFQSEGKTRDERETCFPAPKHREKGAGMR
jgi:hypothetical protein